MNKCSTMKGEPTITSGVENAAARTTNAALAGRLEKVEIK